ncbi:hypothetical protein Barb4_00391 [Bacteroidales bacterium Barb4]|nr:hypothetical protein Barb4_00391 [Bacteroidales bacterium Barb4]
MQRSGMWGNAGLKCVGNVEGTWCCANALKGQEISAPHAAQRNVGFKASIYQ